jgi:WD40 repeat protein
LLNNCKFENMPVGNLRVEKQQTLTGHRDAVYALTAAPSGRHVFSADGNGMVAIWNLHETDRGRLVAQLPASVYALALNPASNHLLVGQNFQGVHEIDWQQNREVRSIKLTDAPVFDLLVAGDFLWVATGDGAVVAVHLPSWTVAHRLRLSTQSARTLAWHAARNEVAVGFSDCWVRVLDAATGQPKHGWIAHGHSVFTAAYAPDFGYLLTGGRDARLKAWDANRNYAPGHDVAAHLFAVNHIAFSPDGHYFVTCSMDKSVKVWSAAEARLLKVIDKSRHAGHGNSVNKAVWTSPGQVLSAGDDRTISVWNLFF